MSESPLPLRTEDIGFLHRVGLAGVDLKTLWKLCDMALAAHRQAETIADLRRRVLLANADSERRLDEADKWCKLYNEALDEIARLKRELDGLQIAINEMNDLWHLNVENVEQRWTDIATAPERRGILVTARNNKGDWNYPIAAWLWTTQNLFGYDGWHEIDSRMPLSFAPTHWCEMPELPKE